MRGQACSALTIGGESWDGGENCEGGGMGVDVGLGSGVGQPSGAQGVDVGSCRSVGISMPGVTSGSGRTMAGPPHVTLAPPNEASTISPGGTRKYVSSTVYWSFLGTRESCDVPWPMQEKVKSKTVPTSLYVSGSIESIGNGTHPKRTEVPVGSNLGLSSRTGMTQCCQTTS